MNSKKFEENEIYDIDSVAQLFGVEATVIEQMIFDKDIKAKRAGSKWLICGSYLESFFAEPDNQDIDRVDVEYLKLELKKRVNDLTAGEEFSIKGLLDDIWSKVASGDKISIGRWFIKQVRENKIKNVKIWKKSPTKTQLYLKEE